MYLFICFLFKVDVNYKLAINQYVKSVINVALRKTNFMRAREHDIELEGGEEQTSDCACSS